MLEHDASQLSGQEVAVTFTKREFECITLATQAKSLSQIAKSLGLKQESVYFYLVNITKKFSNLTRKKTNPLK